MYAKLKEVERVQVSGVPADESHAISTVLAQPKGSGLAQRDQGDLKGLSEAIEMRLVSMMVRSLMILSVETGSLLLTVMFLVKRWLMFLTLMEGGSMPNSK